jgi:ParB family transcriptional regulator, chromosome partitioning protein
MARQTLGRGLSALLGEEKAHPAPTESSLELDIDLIEPNPQQPRTHFDDAHLEELANSIRVNGLVQPIVVRKQGTRYQIVAGERRWRASQRAELRRIPVIVKEVSDDKLLELALVENIQRQELNAVEEAKAYRQLVDTLGLTQEAVAERVGKERSVITTSLRLLKLPNEVHELIIAGKLSAGHGRALLTADNENVQKQAARAAVENNWSVRETERAVKRMSSNRTVSEAGERKTDPNVKAAEVKLMRAINTSVKIVPAKKGSGGKIEIEYYSLDDLDRIYQLMTK